MNLRENAAIEAWQQAYDLAIEWSKAGTMQLHGGEMTAQEIRTVRAMMLGLASIFKDRASRGGASDLAVQAQEAMNRIDTQTNVARINLTEPMMRPKSR